jgi:uncharacterized membrane protein
MKGYFGDGGLRHQDTIFKFGLQGWLMLGTAAAAMALRAWSSLPKVPRFAIGAASMIVWMIPALCAWNIIWTRVVRDPRDDSGQITLSLDGARFLPPSDRKALDWLQSNVALGENVLEAVGQDDKGQMGGHYTPISRISALSGISTPLGWPQHVWVWGEEHGAVELRWQLVRRIYRWPSDEEALSTLRFLKVRYVVVGDWERRQYDAAALDRLRSALKVVFEDGDTFIAQVPDA